MKTKVLLIALGFIVLNLKAQIIADHTVVDQYSDIPQEYIDEVKKMWVQVIGESHSAAYRYGINLLAAQDSKFAGIAQEGGDPLAPTTENLRLNRLWWYDDPTNAEGPEWTRGGGEEDFWTTEWAVNTVKSNITYCNGDGNNPVAAIGFGWCWDMVAITTSTTDTEFGCRWGGRSYFWNGTSFANAGGWGLDEDDISLIDPEQSKENVVCMQDYLDAIIGINSHDANTIAFFSTGPVDNTYSAGSGTTDERNEGQSGYQRFIKHEFIRNYVKANGGYLFDFADILSHNNEGVQQTTSWEDHTFPLVHPDNDGEYNASSGSCHLGEEGCLRLAKAMWWMLAKMAGWENDDLVSIEKHVYKKLIVAPNPVSEQMVVDIPEAMHTNAFYNIINIQGVEMKSGRIHGNSIQASELPGGLYFLKISNGEGFYIGRFMKK